MRPPHSDTSSSSVSLSRKLLRENFSQVAIRGDKQAGHRNVVVVVAAVETVASGVGCSLALFLPLLLPGRSVTVVFLRRRRRERHEEVNLATLELGVGWDHNDLWNDAVFGGGRGRLLQHVLRVCLHDFTRLDAPTDFLHATVAVHYADHVECPTWENARDATPYAVSHGFFSSLFISWYLNSHRGRERERERGRRRKWQRLERVNIWREGRSWIEGNIDLESVCVFCIVFFFPLF